MEEVSAASEARLRLRRRLLDQILERKKAQNFRQITSLSANVP